ncbi:hypothetical protein [Nocardia sp. NPDC050710]|uniref:hypothetical protein n=1 Tax=Nocardia sp. NPDC050710 TaxID=3157220 RepID=UPI0033C3F093
MLALDQFARPLALLTAGTLTTGIDALIDLPRRQLGLAGGTPMWCVAGILAAAVAAVSVAALSGADSSDSARGSVMIAVFGSLIAVAAVILLALYEFRPGPRQSRTGTRQRVVRTR